MVDSAVVLCATSGVEVGTRKSEYLGKPTVIFFNNRMDRKEPILMRRWKNCGKMNPEFSSFYQWAKAALEE